MRLRPADTRHTHPLRDLRGSHPSKGENRMSYDMSASDAARLELNAAAVSACSQEPWRSMSSVCAFTSIDAVAGTT